ncbi:MAG: hypothetical protein QG675_127, partial [Patescibacteria group bacterium]|nr:hypothetical protein [Patescibacteria group bacterium]
EEKTIRVLLDPDAIDARKSLCNKEPYPMEAGWYRPLINGFLH